MDNSHRFFKNVDCKYYPCHETSGELNCLFCYCPLYPIKKCPGSPEFVERNGRLVKNCKNCVFPHLPENYDKVVAALRVVARRGTKTASATDKLSKDD